MMASYLSTSSQIKQTLEFTTGRAKITEIMPAGEDLLKRLMEVSGHLENNTTMDVSMERQRFKSGR